MRYSGRPADCSLDSRIIGMFFSFYVQGGIEQDRTEPIVAVVTRRRVFMQLNTLNSGQQILVEPANMFVVSDMLVGNGHLPTADSGAYVRHPVIVSDLLVLVIGIGFTGLRGVEHDLLLCLGIRTDQRAAARRGDHLIAIERQNAVFAERPEHTPVEL